MSTNTPRETLEALIARMDEAYLDKATPKSVAELLIDCRIALVAALPPAAPGETDDAKAHASRMEDAAFHFLTCAACKRDALCESGRRFEAAMRGEI